MYAPHHLLLTTLVTPKTVELKCTDEETETLNKHICENSSNQTDWFPQPTCGKFCQELLESFQFINL